MAFGGFLKFIQFWHNIRAPNLQIQAHNGALFDTPGVPGGVQKSNEKNIFDFSLQLCKGVTFDTHVNTEGLTIVNFLQPLNSLFEKDEVDSVQCLFWPDMDKHREYAKIDYLPNLHKDGILGLKYLAKNRTVITISRDPQASLVIRSIKGKFDSYNFKLGWGVRCFDHVSVPR